MSRAIILFAHGAREPQWARPFEEIAARLRAAGERVELAFLETMSPDLAEAAARLVREGYTQIGVVPLFLAQGGHLLHDLPRRIEALRRKYPEVDFRVAAPLGESAEVLEAIAAWARRCIR